MEPIIDTTYSLLRQLKSIYMKINCTDTGFKMPTVFKLWKLIQFSSALHVSDDSLILCDCPCVRLWLHNEVVFLVAVDRGSWFSDVFLMTQCSLSFVVYVLWCVVSRRSLRVLKWCFKRSGALIRAAFGWFVMLLFECSAGHVFASLSRSKTLQRESLWWYWVWSAVSMQVDIACS